MALRYPEPPLTDGVVLLRPWEECDLSALQRGSADDYVALIEHIPRPLTDAAGLEWIARKRRRLDDGQGWEFAIVELETGEAVGGVGITFRHPPGAAEPGVWILAEKRGAGLAARATRLLCTWVLTTGTGIARVQATVEPWNLAAQRVLEKLGFAREGLLRSYASWEGSRQDVFLYSLLRSDLVGGAGSET
jgi:ribosomal-protein-alanine N-acetyltransferase